LQQYVVGSQQKRNQLNPITPPRENVQNVHKYWDILKLAEIAKSDHVLYVFSWQGGQIELILFAMSQAS
jgi:hypothetical protein